MEIWQPENFSLFLLFFIPGFISLKIYDSLVPSERRDFSKSSFEVISYSAINFAFFYPVILLITVPEFYHTHKYLYLLSIAFIIFIMPILWPIIYLKILSLKSVSSHIIHPFSKPWDFKFNKREPAWIIVHLKDGRKIGGVFNKDSFASSYPAEEQIYLETVWKLDEQGNFQRAVERSKGIIILKDEILAVEFYE